MREIIFFVASIAGAVVLTALAILLQPDSPIWKWLLWVGAAVFVACAIVLLVDLVKPGGNVLFLTGMGVGLSVLILFAVAFLASLNQVLPDYIYVLPNSFDSGPFRLAVINPGKKTVFNASLRIFDAKSSPASFAASHIDPIGDIEPGYLDLNLAPIPAGYYQIDIRSRGARFVEMLEIFEAPQSGRRYRLAIGLAGKNGRLPPSDPEM